MLIPLKRRFGQVVQKIVRQELTAGEYPDHAGVQSVLDAYEMRLETLEAKVLPKIHALEERLDRLEASLPDVPR